jgi:hypothetical protein
MAAGRGQGVALGPTRVASTYELCGQYQLPAAVQGVDDGAAQKLGQDHPIGRSVGGRSANSRKPRASRKAVSLYKKALQSSRNAWDGASGPGLHPAQWRACAELEWSPKPLFLGAAGPHSGEILLPTIRSW